MGDLYKCKTCGQLCYSVGVSEVDGNQAEDILRLIETTGFLEAEDAVPFLDSDFSPFLIRLVKEHTVRYESSGSFPLVLSNMRADKIAIATKTAGDGYVSLSCPVCGSQEFYTSVGSLPTTFIDGKWGDYVESDHCWYLLSEGNGGNGSITELERRELNNYVGKEDRADAQYIYDELVRDAAASVDRHRKGFTKATNVNLINYFKVLLNLKVDIQLLETRLFELIGKQLLADQEYINAICRTENTAVSELTAEKASLNQSIAQLKEELTFHLREDWKEFYGMVLPQEPEEQVLVKPEEPEYKQANLFNRKAVNDENNILRIEYETRMHDYRLAVSAYSKAREDYKRAVREYEQRSAQIMSQEETAWNEEETNRQKRGKLNELIARGAEVDAILADPHAYAERTLEQQAPARIKTMYDSEIIRSSQLLRKAYQIESDLQIILFVFPKYLDIMAVSKIYEYLVTGRVTSLTGANGAYTLYESEMRANRIPTTGAFAKNNAARDFTIYNTLSSVSKTITELTEKTEAAITEITETGGTEAYEEYKNCIESYYSLIDEELDICEEYSELTMEAQINSTQNEEKTA